METININMTPNCHEVETIHASQNDTSLRKWGIRPYDYDGNDVTSQQDKATLESIKGNTVVWNQNCYSFSLLRSTLSSTINSQTDITCTASSGQTSFGIIIRHNTGYFNFIGGHTYLLSMNISEITVNNFSRISPESSLNPQDVARETGRYAVICNPTVSGARSILCYLSGTTTTSDNFKFNSVQIVDLTMLNDSRITDYDSYKTYYPLSFYPYDSGSLISFNGNGIKTVGKNLLPKGTSSVYNGITWTVNEDGTITANGTASSDSQNAITFRLPSGNYFFCGCADNSNNGANWNVYVWDGTIGARAKRWDKTTAVYNSTDVNYFQQVYIDGEHEYMLNCRVMSGKTANNTMFKPMIIVADADRTYEPYKESIALLPISTYFPNGMDGVGTDYDELTNTKATTRMARVDLGTATWVYNSTDKRFYANIEGVKTSPTNGTAFSSGLLTVPYQTIFTDAPVSFGNMLSYIADKDMLIWQYTTGGGVANINIKDTRYTDATTFKSAMSGVTLVLTLATPIETEITPPLELSYNVYKDGTEELLPSGLLNGSVDLGSLTYTMQTDTEGYKFFMATLTGIKRPPNSNTDTNRLCSSPFYKTTGSANTNYTAHVNSINIPHWTDLYIIDDSVSSASELKAKLQGVYLWYEKSDSTPTTTPLDAAIKYPAETKDVYFTYQVSDILSTIFKFYLVTKGIQIPCELEDDTLVADCTSEISNEPGFFDCKIKAENDLGQIFSNKFQLHIERSPQ